MTVTAPATAPTPTAVATSQATHRQRVQAWFTRTRAAVGRLQLIVCAMAALTLAVMYCSNNNLDAHPEAPRGDGQYRPVLARGDGHMHFLFTRSLVFDRDVNLDDDLARFGDPWNQPRTITGRKNVMQQIGPSLILAPVLAAAHGAALVGNLFGAGIQTHGYTLFHQRIVFATSVLFAWLAVGLGLAVVLHLGGGRWPATWSAIAVALGTTLTYYATYMPSYAHAMDAAACAGFFTLWLWTYRDQRWRRALWLGIMLGVCITVRVQNLLLGSVLVVELALLAGRQLRQASSVGQAIRAVARIAAHGALCLVVALVLFSPQLYVWKAYYGAWITTPQGPGMMRYAHPMVLEFLFSARNGWLAMHPIAYLGVLGLALGVVAGPRIGSKVRVVSAALLLAIATQVYANAATLDWWGSASFGQRRMCSATLPLVVGVAILLSLSSRVLRRLPQRARHGVAIVVLGYFVAWNMSWVGQLRHGATAGRDNRLPCCSDVAWPLSVVAKPIYTTMGNPFALPASALFAWRHSVPLTQWDRVVGRYPLVPPFLGYIDGSYRLTTGIWDLTDGTSTALALHGWAKPQANGKQRWRWTVAKRATALLPLLIPEPHRITIPMFANAAPGATQTVVVRCNGAIVAQTDVADHWTTVTFDTDGRVGESVITIDAIPMPYHITTAPGIAPDSVATNTSTTGATTTTNAQGNAHSPSAPPPPSPLPNATPVALAIGPATVALPH